MRPTYFAIYVLNYFLKATDLLFTIYLYFLNTFLNATDLLCDLPVLSQRGRDTLRFYLYFLNATD